MDLKASAFASINDILSAGAFVAAASKSVFQLQSLASGTHFILEGELMGEWVNGWCTWWCLEHA